MDRISNLPESLIVHILEELPLSDRVKTSSLSSQWRFLWTEIQSMAFDENLYDLICDIQGKSVSEYLHIINSLVLQCPRNARDVKLYIPQEDLGPNEDDLLDTLIKRFLCDEGVERFYLLDEGPFPFCLSDYHFSPTISTTCRLTQLKLQNCKFCPPSSSSQLFPNLISFDLNTPLVSASVISRFVSSCTKLKKIVLLDLYFPQEYLDINAPELHELYVQGCFKWLRLINTENIEALSIRMDSHSNSRHNTENIEAVSITIRMDAHSNSIMRRDISALFDSMAKLEKITLGGQFLQLLVFHNYTLKLPVYDRLKSLEFEVVQLDPRLLFYMWYSITCCSNLTNLCIRLGSDCDYHSLSSGKIKYLVQPEDVFQHLLMVDFQIIGGFNIGMKLIELLLQVSPALKVMSIRFQEISCSSKDSPRYIRFYCMDMLKDIQEIRMFFRASSRARVDIYIRDKLVTKESDVMEYLIVDDEEESDVVN